ncbi:MAG TPA: FAD-binding protein, partial [Bacteroidia bacterium]|nr:FAD-binding protein [Bacteroidia bacterium]
MIKEIDIVIAPHEADNETILKKIISEESGFDVEQINGYKILKRSIDARSRNIKIQLKVQAYFQESFPEKKISTIVYPNSSNKEKVIIAGAGPAGLFAALRLIELGKKPVIIERGKNVKDRRRDLAAINKQHIVNPDSNYCFGEGGAGTYSDGKLYTRSKKRGDVSRILDIFVAHGANEDILTNAHPHIGTNKLPDIIASMRETILNAGGEIHFNTRITDFIIEKNVFKGVITLDEKEFLADNIILATGHSARDIFKLLHKKNILIEAKPFAMGVRVEHPQSLIDSIQYHCPMEEVENTRKHLPAAAYSLVTQVH